MPRGSQTLRRKHTRSAPPAATHHRRQSKDAGSVLSTRSRFSLPVTSPSSSSPTLRASASVTTTASANQTKIFNRALRLQRGTAVRQRELVYEDTAEEERVDAAKAKNRCSKTKGGSTGSIVFDAAKAKNRSKTKSDTSTSSIVWTCEVVHDAAAPPPSSPPPQPRFNNQTQNSVKVLKSRTSPSLARHPPPPPAGKAPLDPELMDFPPRRPPQVIHHFHSAPNEPRDTMPSIAEAYKEEDVDIKELAKEMKNSKSARKIRCKTSKAAKVAEEEVDMGCDSVPVFEATLQYLKGEEESWGGAIGKAFGYEDKNRKAIKVVEQPSITSDEITFVSTASSEHGIWSLLGFDDNQDDKTRFPLGCTAPCDEKTTASHISAQPTSMVVPTRIDLVSSSVSGSSGSANHSLSKEAHAASKLMPGLIKENQALAMKMADLRAVNEVLIREMSKAKKGRQLEMEDDAKSF